MGKGSGRRPMDVSRDEYDANYERIFGKRQRRPYVPPPLKEEKKPAEGDENA